jgi:hypothetical protein
MQCGCGKVKVDSTMIRDITSYRKDCSHVWSSETLHARALALSFIVLLSSNQKADAFLVSMILLSYQ